jgi:hypothetical protein
VYQSAADPRSDHLAAYEWREMAQHRDGVKLGMAFRDGTTIRAHQKAAGAAKKGALQRSGMSVKLWVAHVGASPPRLA